jgi:N-ethylmaleimide reductase
MPNLFSSIRLGPYELPNRAVMAPMTRSRALPGGVQTPLAATYYQQRATAGLLVTEASQVSARGIGYISTPGIYTPEHVAAWRVVTDAVHSAGGRIFLQLWHVGRVSHTSLQPNGEAPIAPSAIAIDGTTYTPLGPLPFSQPRALETHEIAGVVDEFAAGAARAKQAGFDGVEIHGANGYLPDQFLRDGSNHRTDAYGGSIANRARFLLEVTEAVSGVWGKDRVGVRLSPTVPYNGMADSDPRATFGYAAEALGKQGIAYLHLVEGTVAGEAPLTPELKQRFGGLVIANGGFDGESANRVSFGVPVLANPDLVARLAARAPLNEPRRDLFYQGGPNGYIDYPTSTNIQ